MLIIRRPQMDALEQALRRRLHRELCAAVRRAHPQAVAEMSDQQLDELVRFGRTKAASYGLADRESVVEFVGLQLSLGREFDVDGSCPWALELLRAGDGPPAQRLQQLTARAAKES